MNDIHQIKAIRFILAAAALIIGGTAAFGFVTAYYFYVPGAHMSGLAFTEHMILCVVIGTAVFVCVSAGYFLFRAVSQSRLHAGKAAICFVLFAIGSAFIPQLLMVASRAFWPDAFHGDAGWNFLLAFMMTALFLIGLVIIFIVSLIFRRQTNAKRAA